MRVCVYDVVASCKLAPHFGFAVFFEFEFFLNFEKVGKAHFAHAFVFFFGNAANDEIVQRMFKICIVLHDA